MACVGGKSVDADLQLVERDHLEASLDLPPQFGGVGLQSFIRATNEELLGSWASITSDLITFFRSKNLPVYTKLANALESMVDSPDTLTEVPAIPVIESRLAIGTRAHAFIDIIPQAEIDFSTSLVMGERTVEISGRYSPLEAPTRPDPIVLPDLRTPEDYASAPCKHECAVLKQSRHLRQAHEVWKEGSMVQRALMLSRAGQCVWVRHRKS
jgi:hypothetical protein